MASTLRLTVDLIGSKTVASQPAGHATIHNRCAEMRRFLDRTLSEVNHGGDVVIEPLSPQGDDIAYELTSPTPQKEADLAVATVIRAYLQDGIGKLFRYVVYTLESGKTYFPRIKELGDISKTPEGKDFHICVERSVISGLTDCDTAEWLLKAPHTEIALHLNGEPWTGVYVDLYCRVDKPQIHKSALFPTAQPVAADADNSVTTTYPRDPGDGGGVAVSAPPKNGYELTLDRDFDSYSPEELREFLGAVGKLIGIEGAVKLIGKRRGSVILSVELTDEQAETLRSEIALGTLSRFGFTSIAKSPSGGNVPDSEPIDRTASAASLRDSPRKGLTRLTSLQNMRVRIQGRRFQLGNSPWYLRGFTYGPFRPNSAGENLPDRVRMLEDFAHLGDLGCNAIRLYHRPTMALLDDLLEYGLRVLIDVPWEKHRCFFEESDAQENAIKQVRKTARELGRHPGVFAISVGNEIPHDIVRFYGAHRIERFIEKLIHTAKQEAPDCLITYTNYPYTDFLVPRNLDFYCANVYLRDGKTLGKYLDRLQHIAGNMPLIVGEYGVDTIRNSEAHQCEALEVHLHEVFRRGLAGSFVFSYTDDWFTGGHQIKDWAFGVTRADRSEKPAAKVVSDLWAKVPNLIRTKLPRVSVVVCSYKSGATLDECLTSLCNLNYPDYEVILVNDGSRDQTRAIAEKFPSVRYHYQKSMGLGGARNVGAELATGEIVAYTDSDCVADPHWLIYLVQAMEDQQMAAIGGPYVSPESDSWMANCIKTIYGRPSYIMRVDARVEHIFGSESVLPADARVEHICGCNMALRRSTLMDLGGFDMRFSSAGDEIDVFWRLIDAGHSIGYAPAALVWQHQLTSLSSFLKQQRVYGRSEALLQLKHPRRFNTFGYSKDVAGRTFQAKMAFAKKAPSWYWPIIFVLHVVKSIVRDWYRHKYRWKELTLRAISSFEWSVNEIGSPNQDVCFTSEKGHGREHFQESLKQIARELCWHGEFPAEPTMRAIELFGDGWFYIDIKTATEELSWPKRLTRVRYTLRPTGRALAFFSLVSVSVAVAASLGYRWPLIIACFAWTATAVIMMGRRYRSRRAALRLIYAAGVRAELNVTGRSAKVQVSPPEVMAGAQAVSHRVNG